MCDSRSASTRELTAKQFNPVEAVDVYNVTRCVCVPEDAMEKPMVTRVGVRLPASVMAAFLASSRSGGNRSGCKQIGAVGKMSFLFSTYLWQVTCKSSVRLSTKVLSSDTASI